MNILYVIFSRGHASGGHYHSLDQISRETGKKMNVGILSVGSNESPILNSNPHFQKHITFKKRLAYLSFCKEVNAILKSLQPTIINFFDTESYNVLLPIHLVHKSTLILTKCGGPNPQRTTWQIAPNMLFFSGENSGWAKNNSRYKDVHLHVIANRVSKLSFIDTSEQTEKKDKGVFNFVRISRLGGAYEKTLGDTFNLIEQLKDKHPVKLYVIGKIQQRERFESFVSDAKTRNLPVSFITDERTNKASNMLYLADCVIGTGRSLMEAMSLGIPTLTPTKNATVPILVTNQNFEGLFNTNFSERNVADDASINSNFEKIEKLISQDTYYQEVQEFTKTLFEKHFGTDHILEKYQAFYENAQKHHLPMKKLIRMNFPYIVKTILS